MTDTKSATVEVIEPARPGRRKSFTLQQKLAFLAEADQAGNSISTVARRYGLAPNLLFRWKRMREEGALQGLDKNEPVVPESELKAAKARIRELERLLGRKTMEAEILREGLELAREKKLLLRPPLLDKGASR